MNYSDIRSELRSGDILAFSHVGWKSWHDFKIQMVRYFTQSEYSHLATTWVVGNRVLVIEAVMPDVRIYPLSRLGDFYWIPMKANWSSETEEFALSLVGKKYSQLEAIKSYFGDENTSDLWFCSELCKAIAKKDGIIIPGKSTPSDTVLNLQKEGFDLHYVINK